MKALLFATLFASLVVFSYAIERDEYFYGENADASVAFEFNERDTNTTGVVIPVNNGTISYNVTTSSGSGDLSIKIPFTIDGATATLEEATSDNPDFQDPSTGSTPGAYLGTSFFLTITDKDGNEIHEMFPAPIEISLYDPDFDADSDLYIYDTTNLAWVSASSTCPTASQMKTFVDGTLTVNVCHLTQFATFSVIPSSASTTGGSAVQKPASGSKSDTTLIVAIVVPIGAVIIIAAIIIAYAILHRRKKKSFYDLEMANHKPNVVVSTGSKSPQESRVTEFTRGSVNHVDESSSEDSESELEERNKETSSEESSSEEESSQQSEESSQDSDDTDTTNETNSDDSDE